MTIGYGFNRPEVQPQSPAEPAPVQPKVSPEVAPEAMPIVPMPAAHPQDRAMEIYATLDHHECETWGELAMILGGWTDLRPSAEDALRVECRNLLNDHGQGQADPDRMTERMDFWRNYHATLETDQQINARLARKAAEERIPTT